MANTSSIVLIDNSQNPNSLTLIQSVDPQGSFNQTLSADPSDPTVIAAGGSLQITVTNTSDIHGADANLVWQTGPDNEYLITTVFQNVIPGTGQGGNVASLMSFNIMNSPSNPVFNEYATSFFYASQGDDVSYRDYVPNVSSGSIPLYVNFYIVWNKLAGVESPYLPNIKKVVYLMLENRSLDHLLGQLYTESDPAQTYYPSTQNQPYAGLGDNLQQSQYLNEVDVTGDTAYPYAIPATNDPTTPSLDPGESYKYVNNQLWTNTPPGQQSPAMVGFMDDYYHNAGLLNEGDHSDAQQIMGFYTSEQLPVLSGLAKQYAICDEWFCSVPSQTYCNRAFSIAGTSSGHVDNSELSDPGGYYMRTMFNVMMDRNDFDWGIYYQVGCEPGDPALVTYLFDAMGTSAAKEMAQPYSNFLAALQSNTHPSFSYIEPDWFGNLDNIFHNGNDYHPTANLLPGEIALNELYTALTQTEDWNNTLFIVTFDEHGGTYDHFAPPPITSPDSNTYSDDGLSFNFGSAGVRVPTILISPQIQSGMVFRSPSAQPFDHTSIIRTILGWKGIDVSDGVMGGRAAIAPDFSGVLTAPGSNEAVVNPGAVSITPYAYSEAVAQGHKELPPNDLQRYLLGLLAYGLTGKKGGEEYQEMLATLRRFKTVGEIQGHMQRVNEAWKAKQAVV